MPFSYLICLSKQHINNESDIVTQHSEALPFLSQAELAKRELKIFVISNI